MNRRKNDIYYLSVWQVSLFCLEFYKNRIIIFQKILKNKNLRFYFVHVQRTKKYANRLAKPTACKEYEIEVVFFYYEQLILRALFIDIVNIDRVI